MSENPFDNADGLFFVVVNALDQHSIWPDFVAVPAGWRTTFGPATRQDCLAQIERSWTDLRPLALRSAD
jgi:MbtH protein